MITLTGLLLDQLRHSRQRPYRRHMTMRLRSGDDRLHQLALLLGAQSRLRARRAFAAQRSHSGLSPRLQPLVRGLPSNTYQPRHLGGTPAFGKIVRRLQASFLHRCMIPLFSHPTTGSYVSLLGEP